MQNHLIKMKSLFLGIVLLLVVIITVGGYFVEMNYDSVSTGLSSAITANNLKAEYMASNASRSSLVGAVANIDSSEPRSIGTSTDMNGSDTVPILLYHGINSDPRQFDITPDEFKDQMFALKRAGYETVKVADILAFVKGEKKLPSKSFLLTFDDARNDSFKGADPILNALNYTAVMFVPTQDALHKIKDKGGYYLGISDLKAMLASNRWELGSHAMQIGGDSVAIDGDGNRGDFLSNKKWLTDAGRLETDQEYAQRVEKELTDSKSELESIFGIKVLAFAYPSGDYGQQTLNNNDLAVSVISKYIQQNYALAFQQVWANEGVVSSNYALSDPYHLRRIEPKQNVTGADLVALLNNIGDKTFPFADNFSSDRGYKKLWGFVGVDGGALRIKAFATTTGASTILDGTGYWKDYMFSSNLDWEGGSNVTLFSRFKDEGNSVYCTFGDNTVSIGEKVNGEVRILAKESNFVDNPKSNVNLGMSVAGSVARCFIGSKVVTVAYDIDPSLDRGAIGIQVWDKEAGKAAIAISSLKATDADHASSMKSSLPDYPLKPIAKIAKIVAQSSSKVATIKSSQNGSVGQIQSIKNPNESMSYLSASSVDAWKPATGILSFYGDTLVARSTVPITTAFVYAPGGYGWSDYTFSLDAMNIFGSKVSVIGRYADSKNYATCEYIDRGSNVLLVEVKEGKRNLVTIGYFAMASSSPGSTSSYGTVGIRAVGSEISCMRNGQVITQANIPTVPKKGTIGLKIYAASPGFANLEVSQASVVPVITL